LRISFARRIDAGWRLCYNLRIRIEEDDMRIVRFLSGDQPAYGLVEEETVYRLDGSPFGSFTRGDPVDTLNRAELLVPCLPTKIVAIGRNYAEHAREHQAEVPKEPLIFLKPPSALLGHRRAIVLPPQSSQVEHEAELAVVIGARAKNVTRDEAWSHVLGVTCANDVTARDLQRSDGQWSRAKGFDTFCPLGPWIVTDLSPDRIAALDVVCRVNGLTRQTGNTRDLVFDIPRLIAHISEAMTLEPGDVILTGTPAGVGPLAEGDTVEVEIQEIGVLRNSVTK
jgi:2-keto-4-pentenoate hydratase/2-oxohepta-3-ene-1,7-dioic acid hydratase in catechol pathway